MNLIIVESPTKARKLRSYLGSGYKVESSVGHVRDLPKSKLGVDLEHNFKPIYEVSEDKEKVVRELRSLSKKATAVYLAMDPDREGEAIAWHVKYLLSTGYKQANKKLKFHRSTFHEITKKAVLNAIENHGKLNMDLVNAQQARRILDRLVGYKISPVLWKKVRRGLSAGRVQSVALRLIVEREREIKAFKSEEFWEVFVGLQSVDSTNKKKKIFDKGKIADDLPVDVLVSSLHKVGGKKLTRDSKSAVNNKATANAVVKDLEKAKYSITDVERSQRKRQSFPPYITSTVQRAAATKFGYSARQTMALAQKLYENGLITYHRTDSFNLSSDAIKMARNHIQSNFGDNYLPEQPRLFKRKTKNAQEAHEAIRATDINVTQDMVVAKGHQLTQRHAKLYDLIWRRFVASQMTSAIYDQTTIFVKAKAKKEYELRANGSIMKFDGWTRLFKNSGDQILPNLSAGEELDYIEHNAEQKFTQPPPRFNDASLIKELEKRGIGRPSTYASIISVLIARGYAERIEKKFFPSPVAMTVNDFLVKHFPTVMDYDFTAEMEEDLDHISRGEKDWQKIMKTYWNPLEKTIDTVTDKAKRMNIPVEKTGKKCPDCGKTEGGEVVIRSGKYGKFKSCSRYPDCKFTENIVEAVHGVRCPLCQKGKVIARNTRWGKLFYGCQEYPNCNWASWKKPEKGDRISKAAWKKQQAEREERKKKRMAARGEKYSKKGKSTTTKAKAPKSKTKK